MESTSFATRFAPRSLGGVKSYSVSGTSNFGSKGMSYLPPLELGRRELYDGLPFQAVFGLQSREVRVYEGWQHPQRPPLPDHS